MQNHTHYLNILIILLGALIAFLLYKRTRQLEGFEACVSAIPHTIFQTWKSRTEFPENFEYWRRTWMKYNPTYKYEVFDDNDNRAFIAEHFPWFLERFDAYDKPIKKADAIRYFYLYRNGGIYADLDFECLKSFDSLFDKYKLAGVLLGCMADAEDMATTSDHNIPNAIMASRPREEFWICMFHILMTRKNTGSIEGETGPIALKQAYMLYKAGGYKSAQWYKDIVANLTATGLTPCGDSSVVILPSQLWYPISWERKDMKVINDEMLHARNRVEASKKIVRLFPESYAATYWTHTWGDQ